VIISLVALIRKELIQALRDRRMLSMLLMVPTLQVVIFGYAANLEFDHARTVVVDDDRTEESRDFLRGLHTRYNDSGRHFVTKFQPASSTVPSRHAPSVRCL